MFRIVIIGSDHATSEYLQCLRSESDSIGIPLLPNQPALLQALRIYKDILKSLLAGDDVLLITWQDNSRLSLLCIITAASIFRLRGIVFQNGYRSITERRNLLNLINPFFARIAAKRITYKPLIESCLEKDFWNPLPYSRLEQDIPSKKELYLRDGNLVSTSTRAKTLILISQYSPFVHTYFTGSHSSMTAYQISCARSIEYAITLFKSFLQELPSHQGTIILRNRNNGLARDQEIDFYERFFSGMPVKLFKNGTQEIAYKTAFSSSMCFTSYSSLAFEICQDIPTIFVDLTNDFSIISRNFIGYVVRELLPSIRGSSERDGETTQSFTTCPLCSQGYNQDPADLPSRPD